MKYFRAVLSGLILWICVATSFFILEHTPVVKESLNMQTIIICILIIFYSFIGASFYYKKENNLSGIQLAIIMSFTAVFMDALLFVPLVEIPKGNTYQDFFSNPLLWILATINIAAVYFYWKKNFKIK
ncbi:DUF5367 family protein [Flavobacterium sp. DG2-3]|uniref:DUF5367 family protein n=1 Tax=Flavobacterium sp. DG2-3 TaxID=3068317 RepID=UPI00273F1862|nr:DUF5367 family protein [Flavobacterium sp. DG2-3]MDP5201687.1 DUF5367 family protein [Flavobacterium sp. DG2-3]